MPGMWNWPAVVSFKREGKKVMTKPVGSDRKQLYVAMTGAQDELHLFAGGRTRIVQELRESGNFILL